MPVVTIDGKKAEVPLGTTILAAARSLGVQIPVFCFHEALPVAANCRMCLVEVKGGPKPVPSCEVLVRDGMEVLTDTPVVLAARKAALEFLLLNHPLDCPICDQAGECLLQDNYFRYSGARSRLNLEKVRKGKVIALGPNVMLDRERCINCTRCVRFCRHVTGSGQLVQTQRGNRTEIATFPGQSFDDPYSLCTVDLCPVGALTARDFRFRKRAWFLSATPVVCPECARGCSLWADSADGRIYRLRPRHNPAVNGHWACDEGRLAFHRVEKDRLLQGVIGFETGPSIETSAMEAAAEAGKRLAALLARGGRLAMILSASLSLEEGEAAFRFLARLSGEKTAFLAARPEGGQDKLLRLADRDANRAGLALLAARHGIVLRPLEHVFESVPEAPLGLVILGSGFSLPPPSPSVRLELAVAATPMQDDNAAHATVVIPTTAHYERDGHFVGTTGKLHESRRGVAAPRGAIDIHAALAHMALNAGKPLDNFQQTAVREDAVSVMGRGEADHA